jgi:uncharacterized membrane protein YgdD (TMEM256/DUF423 family)
MHKGFLSAAIFIGAFSVMMGAFGAHALKAVLTEQALSTYETAVRYQFYHVFALALTGILYQNWPNKMIRIAGWLFILGIIFFSGSLYLLTYGSANGNIFRWAGAITPVGGFMFILGWGYLGLGIRKK